jgi:tetratricopeptide (TPR) repeat protein
MLAAGGTCAAAPPGAPTTEAPLPVIGEMINGDLPTTYRLPRVATRPAPPVATSVDVQSLFFPPMPAEITLPQTEPVADTPLGGSPPRKETNTVAEIGPIPPEPVPPPAPTNELATQLLPAVQRGYVLAQRGASFAARTEFIQVLRRVAQAKDIATNTDQHSRALAAGLRALDEADDFVPEGIQLEAELDVRVTASSHRTPVLGESARDVSSHKAVEMYHEFSRQQLAKAVLGEQAGSMALYGLGRIDAERAERKDDDLHYVRGAITMYGAALDACPQNHLAANELGVLHCRTGKPDEAVRLFQATINFAPTATAYHNLAVAQQKLGLIAQSQANEKESQRLAAWERAGGTLSKRAGIQWVAPAELARVAPPVTVTPPPTHAVNAPPEKASTWQRTVDFTKSLPRPGSATTPTNSATAPTSNMAQPLAHPHQSQWR